LIVQFDEPLHAPPLSRFPFSKLDGPLDAPGASEEKTGYLVYNENKKITLISAVA
jgi:hypothetical protein